MPFLQRVFIFIFSLFVILDDIRTKSPKTFSIILKILTTIVTALFIIKANFSNPAWWHIQLIGFWNLGLSIVFGYILGEIFSALLPLFFYVPKSIAMKGIGLVDVSVNEQDSFKFAIKYKKYHQSQNHIKVICISGRYLFREDITPFPCVSPLQDFARNGRLDVIMPENTPENPTIAERYRTYRSEFKLKNSLNTMADFLNEIRLGKQFLLSNATNIVSEHKMLCMWRVIIFDHHCIVQSYFPNSSGSASFTAPTFVFENNTDIKNANYYQTFDQMFTLIKSSGKLISAAS
jgi:hypothetical protein